MVQNLRAYFILYVITIKCTKCMQEKVEFSCIKVDLDETKVDLDQNFSKSLLGYKDKATIKNCKKIPRGGKKMVSCCPGVAKRWYLVALGWQKDGILLPWGGICHPMPPHGYGLFYSVISKGKEDSLMRFQCISQGCALYAFNLGKPGEEKCRF